SGRLSIALSPSLPPDDTSDTRGPGPGPDRLSPLSRVGAGLQLQHFLVVTHPAQYVTRRQRRRPIPPLAAAALRLGAQSAATDSGKRRRERAVAATGMSGCQYDLPGCSLI